MNHHFTYIKNLIESSFDVQVQYLNYPFENLSNFHTELRDNLLNKERHSKEEFLTGFEDIPTNHILYLKSSMGYVTILFRFPEPNTTDFIYIGPFLEERFSTASFSKIVQKAKLSSSQSKWLNAYYNGLPLIPQQRMIRVLTLVLGREFPGFDPNHISIHNFKRFTAESLHYFVEHETAFTHDYHQNLLETHQFFFDAFTRGDFNTVFSILPQYLSEIQFTQHRTLFSLKHALHSLNTECRMSLFSTHIPPYFVQKTWNDCMLKINAEMSEERLLDLTNNIISQYAYIYKIHGYKKYSPIIRNIIQYIHSHIDTPLSLQEIANQFNRNRSSLSRQFKNETNTTFTHYVQMIKIQSSLTALSHSNNTVQDIAFSVGFEDQSYFNRVFNKHMHCSPSEYRKEISAIEP